MADGMTLLECAALAQGLALLGTTSSAVLIAAAALSAAAPALRGDVLRRLQSVHLTCPRDRVQPWTP